LLLDFSYQTYLLSGSAFAAFGGSPSITFSRGTNATLIDSTGQLTFAPSNQIPNSESFTAATWAPTGLATTPVVSNATVAPDGTMTADSIVEVTGGASSNHRIDYSGLAGNSGKYAASVYLKAGTRTFARVQFDGTLNSVSSSTGVQIDLSDGTLSSTTTAGNITTATATSENVGNGWYRVGLIFTISPVYVLAGGSVRIFLMQSLSPAPSYIGTGSNIFVWGAQFGAMTYETAPRAYNSTTPKNLLGFTEEFNNAAWNKTNSTITTNAIADPNGYLNADKIVEDTATSEHFVEQSFTAISANTYTYSAYAKAGERNQIVLRFAVGTVFVGGTVQVVFTLTGSGNSFIIGGSPTGSSITALSNGWYRCSISALTVAAVAATPNARTQLYNGTSTNYLGNGTSGAYIWGAQISDSASVDPYVYNPAAALTSTAYYGPRFDYDPVTLAPLGLLIEEARTNLLLNSATLSTQNITTTAQAYTLSFYGTGTVTLSGTSTAGPLVGTGVFPNRVSLTFTPTAGTLTLTVTGTVSNAQLEAGGFATSYIPTTNASATRSADVATMVGNNFSNWYNQTTGTLAVAFDASANGSATYVSASNGTITQNSVHVDNEAGNMRAVYYSGGTAVATIGLTAIGTVGAVNRIATAYAVNDFAASRNGVLGTSITSGALPVSLTQLNIGVDDRLLTANYTSNHIKAISYFNSRLTNAQLQAITA